MRRSHGQRTVANDDGRDAVIAGVSTQWVPGHLGIVMGVVVDDARSDHHPIRIDDPARLAVHPSDLDRKSTRLNSSHSQISYAVFCLKKKKKTQTNNTSHQYNIHI